MTREEFITWMNNDCTFTSHYTNADHLWMSYLPPYVDGHQDQLQVMDDKVIFNSYSSDDEAEDQIYSFEEFINAYKTDSLDLKY